MSSNAPATNSLKPGTLKSATMPGGASDLHVGLQRALLAGLASVVFLGALVAAAVFGAGWLPDGAFAYYCTGLAAAMFAGMATVWLHGRFAASRAPRGGEAPKGSLQALLAAAFVVKLAVLLVGVLALRAMPLVAVDDADVKFAHIATFAVTFAGAALICQLATAASFDRALRRRPFSAAQQR